MRTVGDDELTLSVFTGDGTLAGTVASSTDPETSANDDDSAGYARVVVRAVVVAPAYPRSP